MKTDDLVALLSTNLEPVDRHAVVRTLWVAIAAGLIVALGIAFFGLGLRADLTTTRARFKHISIIKVQGSAERMRNTSAPVSQFQFQTTLREVAAAKTRYSTIR